MTYYEKKRRKIGLSQIDVANQLGISYDRYLLIERGKVKMPTNLMDKFNELINRSKGERDIEKLERKRVVDEWWDEMSQKVGYGKYKLGEKMKEFNIDTYKELSQLLGYKNQSQLSSYLNGNMVVTDNVKNIIYSFFENELNIQPPKEKNNVTQKHNNNMRLTSNEKKELYDWYHTFNISEWMKEQNMTISDMGVASGVAPNTIRAFMRKETPRLHTLKKVHDYIVNYKKPSSTIANNVVEFTLTQIPEEEVPQEIKDSTNKLIEDTKTNTVVDTLIEKYQDYIDIIDNDMEEVESYIKDLEWQIKEKKKALEKLAMKKDIYEELVDTLENGE